MLKRVTVTAAIGLTLTGLSIAIAQSGPEPGQGSSFNDVWSVVKATPGIDFEMIHQKPSSYTDDVAAYGTPDSPRLPQYSGALDAIKAIATDALRRAAVRTVNNEDDYRGYFKKLVHANGTCFSGVWEINSDSEYSGLFKKDSKALLIGRISAASPQTVREKGKLRSFGFAGKLFPTTNPNEKVTTANFFTVHDLNGTEAPRAIDVAYVNEPPVDLSGFKNPLKIVNFIFELADVNPGIRPLYPISRAGLEPGMKPVTPKWMRVRAAPGSKSAAADDAADFRAELSAKNYPKGIEYLIDVSDVTKDPQASEGWRQIGRIRTGAMNTTFGCDRRLHFPHPKFKDPMD